MQYSDITTDQIAEMRARRILLNERLAERPDASKLGDTMLEVLIAGFQTSLRVKESPIMMFKPTAHLNSDLFIALARLVSVLNLHLTGTVDQISRLNFKLNGVKLDVDFAGRRPKVYQNVNPHLIEVKGTLELE